MAKSNSSLKDACFASDKPHHQALVACSYHDDHPQDRGYQQEIMQPVVAITLRDTSITSDRQTGTDRNAPLYNRKPWRRNNNTRY
jgi:hypothetical protein